MRDSFVGDIGDFANNGLLRALCGTPAKPVAGLKLGVVEYFNVPSEKDQKNGAGNIITYLKVSKHNKWTYRQCDEELYDALREMVGDSLVNGKELKIDSTRAGLLLPVDGRYYDKRVPSGDRDNWLADALRVTSEADLVFINPDNGITKDAKSPNHAAIAGLLYFIEQGKSLVIYYTWNRNSTADSQIRHNSKDLQVEFKLSSPPWVLRWHRMSGRAYFIVARTQEHKDKIEGRLKAFRESEWMKNGHFTEVEV